MRFANGIYLRPIVLLAVGPALSRQSRFVGSFVGPRRMPDLSPLSAVGAMQVQEKIDALTGLDQVLYDAGRKEFEKV